MERLRSLIPATLAAAFLALGPGCIHVHTDPDGSVRSVELSGPETSVARKKSAASEGGIKQTSASIPATPISFPSFPRLASLTGGGVPAVPANEIAVAWQNRIAHLPDPARNGSAGAGLVGQMFLFGAGSKMPFAPANGKLVVEIYDESPRAGAAAQPTRLGSWTFDKETLKKLQTVDERFGPCYALFLPWPDYRPEITRVRLTATYEPESGTTLFAPPTSLTIDTSAPGTGPVWNSLTTTVPAVVPAKPGAPGQLLNAPTPVPPGGFTVPAVTTPQNGSAVPSVLPAPTPTPTTSAPAAPMSSPPPIPLIGASGTAAPSAPTVPPVPAVPPAGATVVIPPAVTPATPAAPVVPAVGPTVTQTSNGITIPVP